MSGSLSEDPDDPAAPSGVITTIGPPTNFVFHLKEWNELHIPSSCFQDIEAEEEILYTEKVTSEPFKVDEIDFVVICYPNIVTVSTGESKTGIYLRLTDTKLLEHFGIIKVKIQSQFWDPYLEAWAEISKWETFKIRQGFDDCGWQFSMFEPAPQTLAIRIEVRISEILRPLDELECPICCYDIARVARFTCGHHCCSNCLASLMKDNQIKCPMCRAVSPALKIEIS